ncbi:unnamed protein product [Arctia plantaginis]|uniref:C2H2-type domain-containing protein n=1 Tax=Arctia plantaginis TaxID=874455 RepID=A0A8S1BJ66_ARCPL|nr:unnamed protein product [Arctia plantaginis]
MITKNHTVVRDVKKPSQKSSTLATTLKLLIRGRRPIRVRRSRSFFQVVKAWKCEECGLQFHEADKLALHQVEKHSPDVKSESQFQCTDCRRVFISQKGLTSHRRVHHSTESLVETERSTQESCV